MGLGDRRETNLYSQRGFSDTTVSKDCDSPAIHVVLCLVGRGKGVYDQNGWRGREGTSGVPVRVDLQRK